MADRRDETRQRDRTSNKYAAKKAAERLAAERASQQRAERRRNVLVAGSATLAVLIVVAIIVVIGVTHKSGKTTANPTDSGNPVVPASSTVVDALHNVPATTAVDVTEIKSGLPKPITDKPLTGDNGKPQVLYIGADYCPYCAATRWPLAVALGRFGTFSDLTTTYSSDKDAAPHTPTLSFHGASYTSDYIDFVGKEQQDGAGNPLDSLTKPQEQLLSSRGGNSYPFIDFGGTWIQHGSLFDPGSLSGMTPEQVAKSISDTSKAPGSTIQAGADVYTAIICKIDGGKPGDVCTAPGVKAAASALDANK